jgi:hypothetical protein
VYDPGVLLRSLLIVTALAGCKKKEREMATELPPVPSSGHSVTHFKDAHEDGSGDLAAAGSDAGAIDAAEKVSGAPAYRDPDGRIHGPGGPVNMGAGAQCDASRNHCMRDGVWFAAGNYVQGKLFRATPCFEFEGKWYTWRGDQIDEGGKLFKTRLAKPEDVQAGKPLVVFMPDSDPHGDKWVDSEYEALTSSRWDVAIPDSVNNGTKTFVTRAWDDPLDIETARAIIEEKPH